MEGGTGALVFFIILLVALFVIFIIALVIAATVFWILMIIDCAKREFKNDTEKVVWIVLLVFLGILAAIVYYFVVKREADIHKKAEKRKRR